MDMSNNQYDVFVSYSRKDSIAAEKFQAYMEKMRVPRTLPYPPDTDPLPKRLRLFLDTTDLSIRPESFDKDLQSSLAASRYLIVLCSPHAAQASPDGRHYVDWEIKEFIRIHGVAYAKTHILPVILDGKFNSGNIETECFPPALLDLGEEFRQRLFPVLGVGGSIANASKAEWGKVARQCLSFLTRVDYNIVDNRFQKEKRRTLQRLLAIAAVVILALISLAVWALVEGDKARKTLSQSDFQEASRLIDENQTSMALAYLASSLNNGVNDVALQRFYGLMTNRSWLIPQDISSSSKPIGSRVAKSNDYGMELFFAPNDSSRDGNGRLVLVRVEEKTQGKAVTIPVTNFRGAIFSADAQAILTLHGDQPRQECKVWKASNGSLQGTIDLSNGLAPVTVSPSADYIIVQTSDQKTIRVLSSRDNKILFADSLMTGWQWSDFIFDESSQTLAIAAKSEQQATPSANFSIRTIRLPSVTPSSQISGEGILWSWSLGPDGSHLVYAFSSGQPHDWRLVNFNLKTHVQQWTLPFPEFRSILFNPNGINLAVDQGNGTIAFYDVYGEPKPTASISLQTPVRHWAFSHDGLRLAFVTERAEIGLINTTTGKEIVERRLLNTDIHNITFSRNDRRLAVSTPEGILRFGMQLSPLSVQEIKPEWAASVLTSVIVEKGGPSFAFILASHSAGSILEMHSLQDKSPSNIRQLPLPTMVNCGAFSPDGSLLALGTGNIMDEAGKGLVDIYEIPRGATLQPKSWKKKASLAMPFAVTQTTFSSDGKFLLVASKSIFQETTKSVLLYDVKASAILPFTPTHDGHISQVAFGPDGNQIITAGDDNLLKVWDIASQSLVWSQKLESFPSALALTQDGRIACGMRLMNTSGRIQVFGKNGQELWKSKVLRSGVSHLAFESSGVFLGAGFLNHEALLFDAATGHPRSQALKQNGEITAMIFLSDKKRSVLCVGGKISGNSETGFVKYWDPETSREIGELTKHGNAVQGLWVSSNHELFSWSNALLKTPVPLRGSFSTKEDYTRIAGELGGWVLNQWRAPEEYAWSKASTMPSGPLTLALQWLKDLSDNRALYPGSTVLLKTRLEQMAQESSEQSQRVLDIRPDHALALGNLWFSLALNAAEERYMRPVQGNSRREVLQRQMEWAALTGSQKRSEIKNDPKAMRLADFLTLELCRKNPESAISWKERSIFLTLAGKDTESRIALEKAAKLDPADISVTRLLASSATNPQAALAILSQTFSSLRQNDKATIDDICSFAQTYLLAWIMEHGADQTQVKLDEVLAQLELRAGAALSMDAQLQINQLTEKVSPLLWHLPEGPKLAYSFNQGVVKLFKKSSPQVSQNNLNGVLSVVAFSALLEGQQDEAQRIYASILASVTDSMSISLNYAYIQSMTGNNAQAIKMIRDILTHDEAYGGLLSQSALTDLILFRHRGHPLPCEKEIKSEVIARAMASGIKALTVRRVVPQGQGAQVGVKEGDQVIEYNGFPVWNLEAFINARQMEKFQHSQETRELVINRNGKRLLFAVKPGLLGLALE